jgi:hypothetical protein
MGTGSKERPGRAADHLPPSSAEVMKEKSYTSTHPLGHNRACNGVTLAYVLCYETWDIASAIDATKALEWRGMQHAKGKL